MSDISNNNDKFSLPKLEKSDNNNEQIYPQSSKYCKIYKKKQEITDKITNNYFRSLKDSFDTKKKETHPLEFYALGKIVKYPKTTNNLYQNIDYKIFSKNILKRNYLSINNTIFNGLKKNKSQATIYEQNIPENNHLFALDSFQKIKKYDLPSNVTNKETYNIAKSKLYVLNKSSTIRKGRLISRGDFVSQKKRLLNNTSYSERVSKDNYTLKDKEYSSCCDLTGINMSPNKINNSFNNILENKVLKKEKQIENNLSEEKIQNIRTNYKTIDQFLPKNPRNTFSEKLKNNNLHFFSNFKEKVRERNWWKTAE